ncbi:MAG: hypothetical protein LBP85_08315 [Prevotellaceae bacterium]|jgi:hypothetical protein|nr:hypothetical protein [Prevotellaceae bacterium]
MNTSKLLKILSFAVIVLISAVSCYNYLYDDNGDKTNKDKLTITEAKDVFRQKIRDYETLKTRRQVKVVRTFFPEDYTPQWDKTVISENEYIWSVNVPILTNKRLMVVSREKTDTVYTPAPQKLVIIKSKETQKKYMFILTLIPDRECGYKFKNNMEKSYTHAGDVKNFTGIAMYSTWDGRIINIRKQDRNNIIRLNLKDTTITKSEKSKKLKLATAISGELVLMGGGDDWFLGEIEGSEVTWCQWCWRSIDDCICGEPQYCSVCGYSVCICDEYHDNYDYTYDDVCPNCGRPNCDGNCESGGNDGSYNPPPPQPPQDPPHAYDDWTMDEKTKEELLPALDSIEKDCAGKKMLNDIAANFKIIYNPNIANLLEYAPRANTLSWNMYTENGVYTYGIFKDLFHAYQNAKGMYVTEVVNGVRIIKNLINLEVEAMIAAYVYVKEHGLDESRQETRTCWKDEQKKLMDNYLANPTSYNYNAVLEFVRNLDEYKVYYDRVMSESSNTNLMDTLFNDCEDYEN